MAAGWPYLERQTSREAFYQAQLDRPWKQINFNLAAGWLAHSIYGYGYMWIYGWPTAALMNRWASDLKPFQNHDQFLESKSFPMFVHLLSWFQVHKKFMKKLPFQRLEHCVFEARCIFLNLCLFYVLVLVLIREAVIREKKILCEITS